VLLSAPGLRHLYCDDHHPRVSCSRPSSLSKPRALNPDPELTLVTLVTLDSRAAAISACRTFAHGGNTLRVSGGIWPGNLAGALVPCSVSSASLGKAVRDSGEGLGAIVTNAAQYQINDVRSIKQDSFQVRRFQVQRQCFLFCLRVLASRDSQGQTGQRPSLRVPPRQCTCASRSTWTDTPALPRRWP